MAIRKNNSRASDRVKIKRMNVQGYSNEQISATLSITPEHINYVLTQYETDLGVNSEKAQKEIEKFREAEERVLRPSPQAPANAPDMMALKEQLRAELLEELQAESEEKPARRRRKTAEEAA